jgi:cytohesin
VELLIAKGAEVNAPDKDGKTPLHKAAEKDHQDVAKLLIAKGAIIDIFLASALGLTDRVADFLKANSELIGAVEWGATPLYNAARFGHSKTVQLLIDKGADLEARTGLPEGNWTALAGALSSGHKDTAELLVMAGANVDANDIFGWTLLHLASDKGFKEMVEFLISHGANINAKTDRGSTPLYLATEQGHKDTVKLLIDKGANINVKNVYGRTPLDSAWGRKDIIEMLKKHGAK